MALPGNLALLVSLVFLFPLKFSAVLGRHTLYLTHTLRGKPFGSDVLENAEIIDVFWYFGNMRTGIEHWQRVNGALMGLCNIGQWMLHVKG